jgi:hypothetical protein
VKGANCNALTRKRIAWVQSWGFKCNTAAAKKIPQNMHSMNHLTTLRDKKSNIHGANYIVHNVFLLNSRIKYEFTVQKNSIRKVIQHKQSIKVMEKVLTCPGGLLRNCDKMSFDLARQEGDFLVFNAELVSVQDSINNEQ